MSMLSLPRRNHGGSTLKEIKLLPWRWEQSPSVFLHPFKKKIDHCICFLIIIDETLFDFINRL